MDRQRQGQENLDQLGQVDKLDQFGLWSWPLTEVLF